MSYSGTGRTTGYANPRPPGVALPPESLDVNNIPEAAVISAPPPGSTPTHQSTLPSAQMAYTIARPVDPPPPRQQLPPVQSILLQPRQGAGAAGGQPPFILTEEMLQQYLASQGGDAVPPAPPGRRVGGWVGGMDMGRWVGESVGG